MTALALLPDEPEIHPTRPRAKVRADDLHRGDFIWFAGQVVIKVEILAADEGVNETIRVVAKRGPHSVDYVHLWDPAIPVWVRVPRLHVDN